jgi:transposase-like protein
MAKAKFTFANFKAQYPDDAACLLAILQRRYGNADVCPNCGVMGKLSRIDGRRAFACKEGCHVYPCAGTIFEHSSTPLTLWFHAMYLMTSTRNGVAAKELQRQLGVTYKCAWRIGHQLRELMAARDKATTPEKLSGHVEIDETYIGGRRRKVNRNDAPTEGKTVVMGLVQRGGAFKGHVLPDAKKPTLLPHIFADVAPGTTVSTDTLAAYKLLKNHGYKHGAVSHERFEWVKGEFGTNRIEGFWSHLKNGIRSTHVHVSPQHMQKYVDEFAYRYNNRHDPADMFRRMLAQISKAIS